MDIFKINAEILGILLFLAPGYLGFRLYQIDQPWGSLNTIDVIYGSLIFSTIAYGTYYALLYLGWADGLGRRITSLIFFSLLYGFIWRRIGHEYFHKALHWLGITNEDNTFTAWSRIFNNPKIYLSQISIEMKDGKQLWCNNTTLFFKKELRRVDIYPYYSDGVGNLCVICTHHRSTPENQWEEIPDVYCPAPWGINLTFIPASQIARIDVRATESASVGAA